MPRTKGSKNKPKIVTADFATQLTEKQSAKEALSAEIASITANIDTLKADLKVKKAALKKAEKEVAMLEAKKAAADQKAAEAAKKAEAEAELLNRTDKKQLSPSTHQNNVNRFKSIFQKIRGNLSLNFVHQPIIQPLITPTLRSASGQSKRPRRCSGSRTLRRSSTTR